MLKGMFNMDLCAYVAYIVDDSMRYTYWANLGLRLTRLRCWLRLHALRYCRRVIGRIKGTAVRVPTFSGSEEEEIVVPTSIQPLTSTILTPTRTKFGLRDGGQPTSPGLTLRQQRKILD